MGCACLRSSTWELELQSKLNSWIHKATSWFELTEQFATEPLTYTESNFWSREHTASEPKQRSAKEGTGTSKKSCRHRYGLHTQVTIFFQKSKEAAPLKGDTASRAREDTGLARRNRSAQAYCLESLEWTAMGNTLASVPFFLWAFFPPCGPTMSAMVVCSRMRAAALRTSRKTR